jgi:Ca2+/Na+ antiporter
MVAAWGLLILGLVILLLAGDALVKGAVNLSLRLGVPALIVSLTIVAFGTSAPELLISISAVLDGVPGLALGNVVGSNTANILLVLGVPALLATMHTSECQTSKTFNYMLAASILFIALALFNVITLHTIGEKLWIFYPLFCLTFGCFGMLGANFTALAMEPQGKIAGTASAAYGFASTTVSSFIGYLVAGQFNGTIAPFMTGFVILGVSSLTIILITERGRLFQTG